MFGYKDFIRYGMGALVFGLLLSQPIYALDDAMAIDKAGQQRMLSQRIVKAYLMVATQVDIETGERQLDESVGLFEQNLLLISQRDNTLPVTKAIATVEQKWSEFRSKALSTPDQEKARDLLREGDELLEACQQLVDTMAKSSTLKGIGDVAVAGRQRMLSQRIAKDYIAYYYGLKDEFIVKQLQDSIQEFGNAMESLINSANNTPEIAAKLKQVQNQWLFAKKGFDRLTTKGGATPFITAVAMESVLVKMNDITAAYAIAIKSKS